MTTDNIHNRIAKLCIDHFQNLPKTGKPTANEWTILSCIVKQNILTNNIEVVSLGTGTKCIGKLKMSPNGDILNDSHAEIICRRAFLRYIYNQFISNNNEVFTFNKDISKYYLNNSIKFHFFTTHTPCGDAAIFSKQDSREFGDLLLLKDRPNSLKGSLNDDDTKNKRIKLDDLTDIYRTGAKCLLDNQKQDPHLPGLKFHITGAIRTKPGRGDPTLSVSCSDKIAKWCHLGIQGALLSLLIEKPLYLSSFTISGQTHFCENALKRALYDRLEHNNMKIPYQSEIILMGKVEIEFEFSKADSKRPCPSSIIWCKTNSCPLEVAIEGKKQGVTKKKQNTKSGRLQISKMELFQLFLEIVKANKLELFGNTKLSDLKYNVAKASAKEYQDMWNYLKVTGFKAWTTKDNALLEFVID